MRTIFTSLLLGILLISCSREDETTPAQTPEEPMISNMRIEMNRMGNWLYGPDLNFVFGYDGQKRLIKKTGGYLPMPSSSGFSGIFSKNVYTSLVYTDNKVTVNDFSSSPDFTLVSHPLYYTVNNANQILEKEIPDSFPYYDKKLFYKYQDQKLVEITTTYPGRINSPYNPSNTVYTNVESFFYNESGNLTKTESVYKENGIVNGGTQIRTFENYDSSTNPTKKFSLLEDYFYRSLSKNNFRKYTEAFYYMGTQSSYTVKEWTFSYDPAGQIIFN